MKKIYFLLIIILIILGVFFLFQNNKEEEIFEDLNQDESNLLNNIDLITFKPPLDEISEREIKKTFGIYITPQNSSIQPERFTGYHTGIDFEILPEELDKDVLVYAICSGELKLKQFGSGYGGMIVQTCELDEKPITVVYGHLRLSSIINNIGDNINIGDSIGLLGNDKSSETDYERKHLHISIYNDSKINTRGYVGSQTELLNWIDPCLYICYDIN